MIVENDLKKLFVELKARDQASFNLEGFDISIRVLDHDSKLSLATPVYMGSNYIPKSVRNSLNQKISVSYSPIKTYLTIDELHYQISLNYLGDISHLSSRTFKDLLEEFSSLAQEWRLYLDEHDKHDLVHVRVK